MTIAYRLSRWLPTALRRPTAPRPTRTRLGLTALEDRSVPATFMVTSADDTDTGTATTGTLRKALNNLRTSPDAENTITFQTTDRIDLTADLPTINKNVTIQGRGAGVSLINGNGKRPFTVSDGTAAVIRVAVSGMTLLQSSEATSTLRNGGAIHNDGEQLTITGVTFENNQAANDKFGGAVFNNGGELTLASSTFDNNRGADKGGAIGSVGGTVRVTAGTFGPVFGNQATTVGGAIWVQNTALTVTGSKFAQNQAGGAGGGAIAVVEAGGGTATAAITNSEFDNNSAANGGGGAVGVDGGAEVTITGSAFVQNSATDGGGVGARAGAGVTVTNSTFGKNTATQEGGGIYVVDANTRVTLRSATLGFNTANAGAGLFVDTGATAALFNTLVAKNTTQDVAGVIDPASTGNVIGKSAGLQNNLDQLVAAGNKIGGVGTAPAEFDPQFETDTPAFNGGFTKTFRIPVASPAKDAGSADAGGLAFDQRGAPFARVVGPRIDAGAFEIQDTLREFVVTTAADRFQPGVDPASLSLREALTAVGPDAPTIRFDPALGGQTITLAPELGALRIDRATTITGPGADRLTVSANNQSRVLVIDDANANTDVRVVISGLTLAAGNAGANGLGGAVLALENVTLDGLVVRDSTAFQGGGVATQSGLLTIQNSTLVGNSATSAGGGLEVQNVANQGDLAKVINSTISGNKANGNTPSGGGVDVFPGALLQVFNSTIAANEAKSADGQNGNGGGIFSNQGSVEIVGSIIAGNTIGTTGTGPDLRNTTDDAKFRANFSLIGSPSGFAFAAGFGTGILNGDPRLGPLASNGGPTPTRLPAADSPAVTHTFTDAQVNPLNLTTDQRGQPRKVGAVTDLGAVEFNPNTPPTLAPVGAQTTTTGTALTVPLTVGDAETPGTVTVTATSDNQTLVPNANLAVTGTGANQTLTVTPAAGQTGTATITVRAADAQGAVATQTFTLTVNPPSADTTPPTVAPAALPNVTITAGQTIAPVTVTVGDNVTAAGAVAVTAVSSNPGLVAAAVTGTGDARTVTLTPVAGQTGTATVTVTARDAANNATTRTFTVTVNPPAGGTRPGLVGVGPFAAGSDTGGSVIFYNADRSVRFTTSPFGAGFTGGVRVAAADFNRDGVPDLVVGTGPGTTTRVAVLDGVTQKELFSTDPFAGTFQGGVFVAAGDITGDGLADLVVTPDQGGGPRVQVYTGAGFGRIANFFGPGGEEFRGGARAAVGDVNGDGFADIVAGGGPGGGPRVRAFSGKDLVTSGGGTITQIANFFGPGGEEFRGGARAAVGDVNGDGASDVVVSAGFLGGPRIATYDGKGLTGGVPGTLFNDFFAFEDTLRNGAFVAVGDVNGDGFADIVAGGGPGGGPRVRAFSGKDLVTSGGGTITQIANFFGGDEANREGIRVAVKDLDGDKQADILVGPGTGAGGRVTAYFGKNVPAPTGLPAEAFGIDAFPGNPGVFVG